MGEVHIQARLEADGLGLVVAVHQLVSLVDSLRAPVVRDHEALKAPFLPQNLGEEAVIGRAGHALPAVVGGHDRQGPALLEAGLKGLQPDLPHGALGGIRVVGVTAARGVVVGEVLRGGDDTVLLQALTDSYTRIGGQKHVLAEGLHGAAPTAVAGDIDHGGQGLAHAHHRQLLTDHVSDLLHHTVVEHGGHGDGLGEAGGHAPLGAVEGLAMLQGRDGMRVSVHGELYVTVDALCHLGGSGGVGAVKVHEMAGVAVVAFFMVTLLLVIGLHLPHHLGGELVHFFLEGQGLEQGFGTGTGGYQVHSCFLAWGCNDVWILYYKDGKMSRGFHTYRDDFARIGGNRLSVAPPLIATEKAASKRRLFRFSPFPRCRARPAP